MTYCPDYYGDPPIQKEYPPCPVCGMIPDTVYTLNGEIVGCDNCIVTYDVQDWDELCEEEQRERLKEYNNDR